MFPVGPVNHGAGMAFAGGTGDVANPSYPKDGIGQLRQTLQELDREYHAYTDALQRPPTVRHTNERMASNTFSILEANYRNNAAKAYTPIKTSINDGDDNTRAKYVSRSKYNMCINDCPKLII